MNIKKNVSKMFNVLVVGGALMASDSISASEKSHCKLELKNTEQIFNRITCLDDFDKNLTLNEILEETKDHIEPPNQNEDTCFSPFCGCWLG